MPMKRLILTFLLALAMTFANAQDTITYKCIHYFEGIMKDGQSEWKKTKKMVIKHKVIVTNDAVEIKHKKELLMSTEFVAQ